MLRRGRTEVGIRKSPGRVAGGRCYSGPPPARKGENSAMQQIPRARMVRPGAIGCDQRAQRAHRQHRREHRHRGTVIECGHATGDHGRHHRLHEAQRRRGRARVPCRGAPGPEWSRSTRSARSRRRTDPWHRPAPTRRRRRSQRQDRPTSDVATAATCACRTSRASGIRRTSREFSRLPAEVQPATARTRCRTQWGSGRSRPSARPRNW